MSAFAKVTEYESNGRSGTSVSFYEKEDDKWPFGFGVSKAKKFLAAYDSNPSGVIDLIRDYASGKAKVGDSTVAKKAAKKAVAKKKAPAEAPAESQAA